MSLKLKYFVLNPDSSDKDFARASRAAMWKFAQSIHKTDNELAEDLYNWVISVEPEYYKEEN